jgi:uncharacterized membrane protein
MAIMLTVTAIAVVDIVVRLVGSETGYATVGVMTLSIAAGLFVAIGAAFGGSLVFDYQFNVNSLDGSTAWDETELDQTPGKST